MLKAILFDLDNTLVDFMSFKKKTALAAAKALKKHGWKLSEKQTVDKIFKIYDEKGIEYQKTFADLVYGQGYGGNGAEKLQQAAILAYLREKERALKPFAGVEKTLAKLKKRHVLAILSDAPRNKAWQRLIIAKLVGPGRRRQLGETSPRGAKQMAGLDKYFAQVGTFTDSGKYKPEREPFLLMCRKLKARPSECLFVGDNPERDIKGAKAVGMKTAWAKYGHVTVKPAGLAGLRPRGAKLIGNQKKGRADFVLRKAEDLIKVIKQLEIN